MGRKNAHIVATTTDAAKRVFGDASDPLIEFGHDMQSLPFTIDDVWVGSRDLLESDESFKQIIPYTIVERGGKVLAYRRTSKGGEARLHGDHSIGFGGHIDIGDVAMTPSGEAIDLETTVANAVRRELMEELKMDALNSFECYGMLLDESNEVGRVHVGIVMVARVSGMVLENEDQIEIVGFKDLEDLKAMRNDDKFENWSSIVIDHLVKNNGIPV